MAIAYVVLSVGLAGAALVVAHLFPVVAWDDGVSEWLAARRTPGWDSIAQAGTFVANTLGVVVVASVVTTLAAVRRMGRVAFLLVAGLALEITLFLSVNYAVARPRPDAPHLGSTPSTYSFPSGHVAATVVLYGGIAVLVASRTRVRWARVLSCLVAALLVTWVGFSRMYSAQHHPTDVVAGLVMGMGALAAAVLAVRPTWVEKAEEDEGT
jgi:membrane-associated phospholipid phosphatase